MLRLECIYLLVLLALLNDIRTVRTQHVAGGSAFEQTLGNNSDVQRNQTGSSTIISPTAEPETVNGTSNETEHALPEVEPTPEPGNGYNGTAEGEPKGNGSESESGEPEGGTAEPEGGSPEPEGGSPEAEGGSPEPEDSFAEPAPEWESAKSVWKGAWEFHVYVFGCLFAILGIFCLACIFRLWKMNHLLSKHYFLSLHVLNVIICVLRSVYLFVDAYNSRGIYPVVLDYFLYTTVFPCLTALFSLLFYALLLATRFRRMSQKVQNLRVLVSIIAVHFILSFVTDITVGLSSSAAVLIFICQLFNVIWGLSMFIGYAVIFKRMYERVVMRQNATDKKLKKKYETSSNGRDYPKHKHTLGMAVKVTLASAIFGVACIAFQLFGMFGVYGVIGHYSAPDPWAWWVYHTGQRLLELIMCFSMAIVSSQPLKLPYKDQKLQSLFCLLPCCLMCYHKKLVKSEGSTSFSLEPSVITDTNTLKVKT